MDSTTSEIYNFKIVLLGEGSVGKTSLVLRYVEDKFNDKHLTTLQASYLNKKLNINGKKINLAIWDTAGQEKFHALGPIYYRMSNGAVLVYDITDEDSFQKVKSWVKELKKMLGNEICLVIVGNKADLEKERNVPTDRAMEYAKQVGAEYFEASAKLNRGVDTLFLELAQVMLRKADEAKENTIARKSSLRRSVLVVDDDSTESPAITTSRTKCCGGTS